MHRNRNIILTGVPRSGTSLVCQLLNQLDNVVALQEPMNVELFGFMSGWSEIKDDIDLFFENMRNLALTQGKVISQQFNGKIVENFFHDPDEKDGRLRNRKTNKGIVDLDKKVDYNMTMILKHNAAFTALCSELSKEFSTFAVIRNPLWAIASWNSNNLPIQNGRIPMAEQLDAKLANDLDGIPDRLDRQIHILSWIFDKFSLLDKHCIIRYEELIKTNGQCLEIITPSANSLRIALLNKNQIERYSNINISLDIFRKRLLSKGGSFFDFYPKYLVTY